MNEQFVVGLDVILKNIDTAKKDFLNQLPEAILSAAQLLLEKSRYLCPIDEGDLHDSSGAKSWETPIGAEGQVFYGPPDNRSFKYAPFVHENPQRYLHGAAFNAAYARKIQRGYKGFAERRPQEQEDFLRTPALDSSVQKEMIKLITDKLDAFK